MRKERIVNPSKPIEAGKQGNYHCPHCHSVIRVLMSGGEKVGVCDNKACPLGRSLTIFALVRSESAPWREVRA
jgi:hypothetical protein